ncbi:hypothetical protein C8J57DRAFT_985409, partial [Mycena rebaudengoi]
VSFTFASTRTGTTGILNSAVVGWDACPYFHVMTDAGWLPGHTVFRTNKGHTIASVEWRGKGGTTFVEIQPSVMKQPVSAWLVVSADASYRTMYASGQTYVWVPRSQGICVSRLNSRNIPRLLARIVKEDDSVTLDISLAAIEMKLMEACVVATVLFQSGRRID